VALVACPGTIKEPSLRFDQDTLVEMVTARTFSGVDAQEAAPVSFETFAPPGTCSWHDIERAALEQIVAGHDDGKTVGIDTPQPANTWLCKELLNLSLGQFRHGAIVLNDN
jgi:hypothetical protein